MGRQDLTYAVARIRALETKMFTEEDLNRLLACPTEDDAVEMLMAKGWGNGEDAKDGETILEHELDKTWETVRSLVEDMSTLDVLSYKDLHHNIKSAMKQVASGVDAPETYIDNSFYSADIQAFLGQEAPFYSNMLSYRQDQSNTYRGYSQPSYLNEKGHDTLAKRREMIGSVYGDQAGNAHCTGGCEKGINKAYFCIRSY